MRLRIEPVLVWALVSSIMLLALCDGASRFRETTIFRPIDMTTDVFVPHLADEYDAIIMRFNKVYVARSQGIGRLGRTIFWLSPIGERSQNSNTAIAGRCGVRLVEPLVGRGKCTVTPKHITGYRKVDCCRTSIISEFDSPGHLLSDRDSRVRLHFDPSQKNVRPLILNEIVSSQSVRFDGLISSNRCRVGGPIRSIEALAHIVQVYPRQVGSNSDQKQASDFNEK